MPSNGGRGVPITPTEQSADNDSEVRLTKGASVNPDQVRNGNDAPKRNSDNLPPHPAITDATPSIMQCLDNQIQFLNSFRTISEKQLKILTVQKCEQERAHAKEDEMDERIRMLEQKLEVSREAQEGTQVKEDEMKERICVLEQRLKGSQELQERAQAKDYEMTERIRVLEQQLKESQESSERLQASEHELKEQVWVLQQQRLRESQESQARARVKEDEVKERITALEQELKESQDSEESLRSRLKAIIQDLQIEVLRDEDENTKKRKREETEEGELVYPSHRPHELKRFLVNSVTIIVMLAAGGYPRFILTLRALHTDPGMAVTNFTIDDRSPLIRYDPPGAWTLGDRKLDPDAARYNNNGTFTLSITAGASASFTFNGTAVWIFGAKRINHGPYEVVLDGVIFPAFKGLSIPGEFQTPLFSVLDLKPGSHSVSITNKRTQDNQAFLDIDFGDSVMVVGSVDPGAGEYTVELDGGSPQTFNATVAEYVSQTPLYFADNLGPGNHTLKLVNSLSIPKRSLTIDYASVGRAVYVFISLDPCVPLNVNSFNRVVARTAIPSSIVATPSLTEASQTTTSLDTPPFSNNFISTTVPSITPTQRSELAGETKQLTPGNIAALATSIVASVFVVSLLLFIWKRRRARARKDWKNSSRSGVQDGIPHAWEFGRTVRIRNPLVEDAYSQARGQPTNLWMQASPLTNATSKRDAARTLLTRTTNPSAPRIAAKRVNPPLPPNPPSYDELLSNDH
ncbi:hypothetical protein ONZ45_g4248 [Pleurotus djamor]|nr:hypothetical protein ONZ45_g4248 [Pleurotus djamor]